jgi:FAD/FMN-containing dehydrogenase
MQAVQFAAAHDVLVAVRAGGHSAAGKSVCDGGLMIDLSAMREVKVDPARRIARVQGGALLADLDRAAQAHGLVCTAGTVSHTGIGGLTLGGGFGHLARQYGLTIDHLRVAEVVTAKGERYSASADDNPDLFWGVRGGGGNFGIVTSFEFNLHAFGTTIQRGQLVYPFPLARRVLQFLSQYAMELPDETTLESALVSTPKNERILSVTILHAGSLEGAERHLNAFKAVAAPAAHELKTMSYLDLQSEDDVRFGPGQNAYLKAGFMREMTEQSINAMLASMEEATLPVAQAIAFPQFGGAISRIDARATAFAHRDAASAVIIPLIWQDPSLSDALLSWGRAAWKRIEPSTRGTYVNFLVADDPQGRIRESYGINFERMIELKNKYDPTNLFRLNANVEPTTRGV